MDIAIKKRACRPELILQLAPVCVSGSTCSCCGAFQNQRLLNLCLLQGLLFPLKDLPVFPRVHVLYSQLGENSRSKLQQEVKTSLAEGSTLEKGQAEFADGTDNPTDLWPYDMSFQSPLLLLSVLAVVASICDRRRGGGCPWGMHSSGTTFWSCPALTMPRC